jgi:hypothetical protein
MPEVKARRPAVRERPIIFTADSVRAILEGRKTQARRVALGGYWGAVKPLAGVLWRFSDGEGESLRIETAACPYGVPGDRLWVKEGFAMQRDCDGEAPPYNDGRPIERICNEYDSESWLMPHYRATDPMPDLSCEHKSCEQSDNLCRNPWNSPLFMPRWASRITLEITAVRVQRVQEISEEDAIAEACNPEFEVDLAAFVHGQALPESTHRLGYKHLWDSINARRGFSWQSNPWCWVISFRKLEASRG